MFPALIQARCELRQGDRQRFQLCELSKGLPAPNRVSTITTAIILRISRCPNCRVIEWAGAPPEMRCFNRLIATGRAPSRDTNQYYYTPHNTSKQRL